MAVAWQAEFRQLSRASQPTSIFQARSGNLLLSNARLGCMVDQRGATPQGMRTFAIQADQSSPMNWFGHQVDSQCLLLFPRQGDIDVVSQEDFSVYTFSLPETLLQDWFELHAEYSFDKLAGKQERVFALQKGQADRFRSLLASMAHAVGTNLKSQCMADIEERLLQALHTTLAANHATKTRIKTTRPAKLGKILEYGREHATRPLSVTELCTASGLSERGLQQLFKRELDITPRAYLIGHRLYQAHQLLWHAVPGERVSVSSIASDAGFSHFGQFAAAYRRQFGELPSETLRRTN